MAKKLRDITPNQKSQKIDLSFGAQKHKKTVKLKKDKHSLYKSRTPITQVKDLSGIKEKHYLYFKGEKHNAPKFLGNLLKIAVIGFLIILAINLANIYNIGKKLEENVSTEAYAGYSYLVDAGKSTTKIEFDNAVLAFDNAIKNFSQAQVELWFISTDKSFYSNRNDLGKVINSLLNAGKHFAVAGNNFLDALEEFNKIPLYFVAKNRNEYSSPSITDTLKFGLKKTQLSIEEISKASALILEIDEAKLPPEIKARVKFAKEKIQEVQSVLKATSEHFPAILKLLGDLKPHRYLIILQNNNEIRPTGGFIGSYALLDIEDGYIKNLKVEDVYDIDNAYKEFIQPPDELKDYIPDWRFRDANYSPDFPVSAAKLRWFLEREGGPVVDTVIAINQGLLRDMLEITGPVQVGDFGKLNSENYNVLLSYVIEGKIWGAEDPKHILKVFIPAFKEEILKEKNIGKVGSKLFKALKQKHIMLYSNDSEVQELFDAFEISGRVHQQEDNEDYLSVIHSSVGWNKSDQFIEEEILHETLVNLDGSITNEVTIKRKHNWSGKILEYWKNMIAPYGFTEISDHMIEILGRGENKVLTRIYVPADSILLESNGADVSTKYDKDLKKTYFFTTMKTKPGSASVLKIKYLLPFDLNFKENPDAYKIFIDKQPGSRGSVLTKTFENHPQLNRLSSYPDNLRTNGKGTLIYATNLVYDRYFATALSK